MAKQPSFQTRVSNDLVKLLGDSEDDPGRKEAARRLEQSWSSAKSSIGMAIVYMIEIKEGRYPPSDEL